MHGTGGSIRPRPPPCQPPAPSAGLSLAHVSLSLNRLLLQGSGHLFKGYKLVFYVFTKEMKIILDSVP